MAKVGDVYLCETDKWIKLLGATYGSTIFTWDNETFKFIREENQLVFGKNRKLFDIISDRGETFTAKSKGQLGNLFMYQEDKGFLLTGVTDFAIVSTTGTCEIF